jgi:hypothetical protein
VVKEISPKRPAGQGYSVGVTVPSGQKYPGVAQKPEHMLLSPGLSPYVPGSHFVQDVDPGSEKLPGMQNKQGEPLRLEYFPAGQSVQGSPGLEDFPAEQEVHEEAIGPEDVPAGHARQLSQFGCEKKPGTQALQIED